MATEEFGFEIVKRYSAWQKKNVRTVVVNGRAKNQTQRSLAAALALAQPYDRIELAGGTYNECIAINTPLELVAADGEQPVLTGRQSCITVVGGVEVYLAHLTVQCKSADRLEAAVVLSGGSATLYRCTCSSVRITGTATPWLERCTIKQSASGVGVLVQEAGGGTLLSCVVHSHVRSCLEADTRGHLLVKECTLYTDPTADGVDEGAVCTVLSIYGSQLATLAEGVSVGSRSGGERYTASVPCASGVEVSNCHIYMTDGNAGRGGVAGGADAAAMTGADEDDTWDEGQDDFSRAQRSCVAILNGAAPTFTGNELAEGDVGFLLRGAGAAQLMRNHVMRQRRCGMLVYLEDMPVRRTGELPAAATTLLPVTCDNVFDHCAIGVDVRCLRSQRSSVIAPQVTESATAVEGLHGRRAFHWGSVQQPPVQSTGITADAATSDPASAQERSGTLLVPVMRQVESDAVGADLAFLFEGASRTLEAMRASLVQLAQTVLRGYGTTDPARHPSQDGSFVVSGSGAMSRAAYAPGEAGNLRGQLARLLEPDLETNDQDTTSPAQRVARSELCNLRGGGLELCRTRFVECAHYAIRFARRSFGLVEDCEFDHSARHAILVENAAHPMLVHCRFRRGVAASVVVSRFANPFLIDNVFDGGSSSNNGSSVTMMPDIGAEYGILVRQHGRGLVMGNWFSGHVKAGIRVCEGGETVVVANVLTRNAGGGIVVEDGSSQPLVLFNECVHNGKAQLSLAHECNAMVAGNLVHRGTEAGIALSSCSRCTLFRNVVTQHVGDGVVVELDADPVVEGNWLGRNRRSGVRCHNNGLGNFVGNVIHDNSCGNVLVCEGAAPVFRANVIRGGSQGGLVVQLEGAGCYEHNDIAENGTANVLLFDPESRPRLVANKIRNSASGCGVWCARGGRGVFWRNAIYENKQCGVCVMDGADPTFRDNAIAREAIGVLVQQGGRGQFVHNTLTACYGSGVVTQSAATPQFTNNRVTQCAMSGLLVGPDGGGSFTDNEWSENDVGVQLGSSLASAQVDLGASFFVRDGATAQRGGGLTRPARATVCLVQRNHIHHNHAAGVLLERQACGEVSENDIYDNDTYGIRAEFGYAAQRAQTLLAERYNMQRPIAESGDEAQTGVTSTATLRANRVHRHAVANVFASRFTSGQVELVQNDLFDAPVGLCATQHARLPRVHENVIHACHDGVSLDAGAQAEMTGNRIHHCRHAGIYVSDRGAPSLKEGNVIEFCQLCGILVDAMAAGCFTQCTVRHCHVGVIVYCGPTTPFQAARDVAVRANATSATTRFVENDIEQCTTHGVLIVSVANGCPLRVPRAQMVRDANSTSNTNHPPAALHFAPQPITTTMDSNGLLQDSEEDAEEAALCASFVRNKIHHHRLFGVYHDRFEHWDVHTLEAVAGGESSFMHGSSSSFSRPAPMPHVHGGYERLLGTSQIMSGPEHEQRRSARQVSLVENVVSDCSFGIGVGADCHPFLLRNRVLRNVFVGLLLRHGSALMSEASFIAENGMAGVYSVTGAKGQLHGGTITENNVLSGLFVDPVAATAREAMRTAAFVHEQPPEDAPSRLCDATSALPTMDQTCASVTAPAYEQLNLLLEVQLFVITESIDDLCTRLSRARAIHTAAEARVDDDAKATTAMASSWPAGIGVWLEHGSRTTIRQVTVTKHARAGVVFAKGVRSYREHDVPVPASTHDDNDADKGSDDDAWSRRRWHEVASAMSCRPALANSQSAALFTRHDLCASGVQNLLMSATLADSMNASLMSSLTFPAEAMSFASLPPYTNFSAFAPPALHDGIGSSEAGAVAHSPHRDAFTDQVQRAAVAGCTITQNRDGVQLVLRHLFSARPAQRWCSLSSTQASTTNHSGMASQMSSVHTIPPPPPLPLAATSASHHSNTASHQVHMSSSNNNTLRRTGNTPFEQDDGDDEAEATHTVIELQPQDTAIMTEDYTGGGANEEHAASAMNFAIVLCENTLRENACCGVRCTHLVEVESGAVYTEATALRAALLPLSSSTTSSPSVASSEGGARTSSKPHQRKHLSLSTVAEPRASGGDATNDTAASLPFSLDARPTRVMHALLLRNTLSTHDATQYQAEVSSHYVAITEDQRRTTVPCSIAAEDVAAVPSSCLSLLAAFLQQPPPGLFLYEGNTFTESARGVRVGGYVGPRGVRFQRNVFRGLTRHALCVEGHLACATIGGDNVFESNAVGIELCDSASSPTSAALASWLAGHGAGGVQQLRTRIFGNTFTRSGQVAVRLAPVMSDVHHVLLYRNVFREHAGRAAALLFAGAALRVLVQENHFTHNVAALVLCGDAGKASMLSSGSAAVEDGRSVFVTCNYFAENHIGTVVCDGAAPLLLQNVFARNTRAGLELAGLSSYPVVRECVFAEAHGAREAGTSWDTHGLDDEGKLLKLPWAGLELPLVPCQTDAMHRRALNDSSSSQLAAGLLTHPLTAGIIEGCLFVRNDVGADLVTPLSQAASQQQRTPSRKSAPSSRSSATSASVSSTAPLTLRDCVFRGQRVAGVTVRGCQSSSTLLARSPRAARAVSSVASTMHGRASIAVLPEMKTAVMRGGGGRLPGEDAVTPSSSRDGEGVTVCVESCYFDNVGCGAHVSNANGTDNNDDDEEEDDDVEDGKRGATRTALAPIRSGDVRALARGKARFVHCIFYGTVHALQGSAALFTHNHFIRLSRAARTAMRGSNGSGGGGGDMKPPALTLADVEEAKKSVEDATPGLRTTAALLLHAKSAVQATQNVFYARRVAVHARPGASGWVTQNQIVRCRTGLLLAPHSHTTFAQNRLLHCSWCAALVFGGELRESVVFRVPSGIVLKPETQYKDDDDDDTTASGGERTGAGPMCVSNTIMVCDGDGVLVLGVGTVAENVVTNCKTGIHINCTTTAAAATASGTLPKAESAHQVSGDADDGNDNRNGSADKDYGGRTVIRSNHVMDSVVGIWWNNESIAYVEQNDVFDNSDLGLLVLPTATGVLRGNRISSYSDEGAARLPSDPRLRMMGNVLRNQFSPPFRRLTRLARAKEHNARCTELDHDVAVLEDGARQVSTRAEAQMTLCATRMTQLMALLQRTSSTSGTHPTGQADVTLDHTHAGSAGPALRRASRPPPTTNRDSKTHARISPAASRRPSADSRRPSLSATLNASRRRSSIAPLREPTAAGVASPAQLYVLVHVFALDTAATAAADNETARQAREQQCAEAGQSVALFCQGVRFDQSGGGTSAGLSVVTTVTTSSAALLHHLRSANNTKPDVAILAVMPNTAASSSSSNNNNAGSGVNPVMTGKDRNALLQLHLALSASTSSAKQDLRRHSTGGLPSVSSSSPPPSSADEAAVSFTLLPQTLCLTDAALATAPTGGMSLKDYAVAHTTLFFRRRVEEVLPALQQAIMAEVTARRRRTPLWPANRRTSTGPSVARPPLPSSTHLPQAPRPARRNTTQLPSTAVSEPRMTQLIDLLTPQALGLTSREKNANPASKPRGKRRKNSTSRRMSNSGTLATPSRSQSIHAS